MFIIYLNCDLCSKKIYVELYVEENLYSGMW